MRRSIDSGKVLCIIGVLCLVGGLAFTPCMALDITLLSGTYSSDVATDGSITVESNGGTTTVTV